MRRSRSKQTRLARRSIARKPKLSINVTRSAGRVTGLRVSGHAGFAPRGSDVVCAGVSALVLSGTHGLRRYCRAVVSVDDDPHGDYVLEVQRGGDRAAQALLETLVAGLQAIARSYPGYVKIRQRRSRTWTR